MTTSTKTAPAAQKAAAPLTASRLWDLYIQSPHFAAAAVDFGAKNAVAVRFADCVADSIDEGKLSASEFLASLPDSVPASAAIDAIPKSHRLRSLMVAAAQRTGDSGNTGSIKFEYFPRHSFVFQGTGKPNDQDLLRITGTTVTGKKVNERRGIAFWLVMRAAFQDPSTAAQIDEFIRKMS